MKKIKALSEPRSKGNSNTAKFSKSHMFCVVHKFSLCWITTLIITIMGGLNLDLRTVKILKTNLNTTRGTSVDATQIPGPPYNLPAYPGADFESQPIL